MTEFNPAISLFISANKPTRKEVGADGKDKFIQYAAGEAPALTILHKIKKGTDAALVGRIEQIRREQDKKKRAPLKKDIECVTWSGTFGDRNEQGLQEYSGIICIDIDAINLGILPAVKKEVCKLSEVFSCFLSTSGNGLKILFRVKSTPEAHKDAFFAIGAYLEKQGFMISNDTKCQDITRLCFLSYDPDLYLNEEADVIGAEFIKTHLPPAAKKAAPAPAPKRSSTSTIAVDATPARLDKCHEVVQREAQAVDGQYNTYINNFAIQAIRWDIDESDVIRELRSYCNAESWTDADREVDGVVRSVYNNPKFSNERGKYLEGRHTPSLKTAKPAQPKAQQGRDITGSESVYDTSTLFWFVVKKKAAKDSDEIIEEYRYSYDDAMTFLQNNGFWKYRLDNGGYQLIYVNERNKVIDIANELTVKEFVLAFLKTDDSLEYKRVREMFRKGFKNYVSIGQLEGLEYYNPELKRDTDDKAYMYFTDCYIEVTKDRVERKQYHELDGYIWRKQIINKPFTLHTAEVYRTGDFYRFLQLTITGIKLQDGQEYGEEEQKKFRSMCSSIGYLLHQYKNPAVTKAVIAVDKKLRITGEQNGRSGKSLVGKALQYAMAVTTLDGRNFKFDYEFAFQAVNLDTRLLNFNDVPKNFPFDRLYGIITEDFTYNKKKVDSITIPFSDAPKHYITTNHTIKGEGDSDKGRQQIIEFTPYFNASRTPYNEFGRLFFGKDWCADEWSKFYSFFIDCVRIYLAEGLIAFPLENYAHNKLIDTTGEDFIYYMDEQLDAKRNEGNGELKFDTKKLYGDYVEHTQFKNLKQNTFTKWVRMWAEVYGYIINGHKGGERDRSNGTDYMTFTHKDSFKKVEVVAADTTAPAATATGNLNFKSLDQR